MEELLLHWPIEIHINNKQCNNLYQWFWNLKVANISCQKVVNFFWDSLYIHNTLNESCGLTLLFQPALIEFVVNALWNLILSQCLFFYCFLLDEGSNYM